MLVSIIQIILVSFSFTLLDRTKGSLSIYMRNLDQVSYEPSLQRSTLWTFFHESQLYSREDIGSREVDIFRRLL